MKKNGLKLLKESLKKNPYNAFAWFYLAKIHKSNEYLKNSIYMAQNTHHLKRYFIKNWNKIKSGSQESP